MTLLNTNETTNAMKNKYEVSDNYLLRLENETLRERLLAIQDKLNQIEKILLNGKKDGNKPS